MQSNLSMPTVSGITAQLIEMGLIYEQSTGASTGGRRPVLVAFNPRAGYVVGIKVAETTAIAVLTDLTAGVIAHHSAPIHDHRPEDIVATLAAVVTTLAAAANGAPLLGVGIGMASVVDRRRAWRHRYSGDQPGPRRGSVHDSEWPALSRRRRRRRRVRTYGRADRWAALCLRQTALDEYCFGGLRGDVTVVIEPWGDDGGARGTASLLLSELFEPALHKEAMYARMAIASSSASLAASQSRKKVLAPTRRVRSPPKAAI